MSDSPPDVSALPSPGTLVGGRYRLGELVARHGTVGRFKATDEKDSAPVTVVCQPAPEESTSWPGTAWERDVLSRATNLSLPRVQEALTDDAHHYLVAEAPEGRPLLDAWGDPRATWKLRFTWLTQIAEALGTLHRAGAMLPGLRPGAVSVTMIDQAVIADLSGLRPLPAAPGTVGASLYAAPELLEGDAHADARADLYAFGATLHALLLGRELAEADFVAPGLPRSYPELNPDSPPQLGRLLARTFTPDPVARFPSGDSPEDDPTGFRELLASINACAKALELVRFDVAAWTDTGVGRSANEDAVGFLHVAEAKLEESEATAVAALADGMGGMASGEVAAALTVRAVLDYFRHRESAGDRAEAVRAALREANRAVVEAARADAKHGGMGCTAEVILVEGRRAAVGHVGDSRVYHFRGGRLAQVTHDHTFVNQLVRLGMLTTTEAERHPKRSELQQAIGGRRDLNPDVHEIAAEPGDWLLACSDGLSNTLKEAEMAGVLGGSATAEQAARRLVNLAILRGAQDNASVVVIRVY
jgi:serine/threonine protein phosphatase PrpC